MLAKEKVVSILRDWCEDFVQFPSVACVGAS
jgi:hypothetical protein